MGNGQCGAIAERETRKSAGRSEKCSLRHIFNGIQRVSRTLASSRVRLLIKEDGVGAVFLDVRNTMSTHMVLPVRVGTPVVGMRRLGRRKIQVIPRSVPRRRLRTRVAVSQDRHDSSAHDDLPDDTLVKHTHDVQLATTALACILATTPVQPCFASEHENQQRIGVDLAITNASSGDQRVADISVVMDTATDAVDPSTSNAPPVSLDESQLKESGDEITNAENENMSPSKVADFVTAAVRSFIKPLLSEFGAAVLGFGGGAVITGLFMGWQQSQKNKKINKAASRQALADLSTLDESEITDLIGELPAWLAFRDVERGGWVNKVLSAAWPYLDKATSDVIVKALDPILTATRPSFLTALRFETWSFGSVPAKIEGVKVYETVNDGAVEIDLTVFWAGDPDVVLGVKAAQDTLSVPVSLTEFQCAFTLRLIFAPLIGVFPCFGALTIALVDEPQLDFDLRVVGGDVTLVPGLKESLRTYIKALIASWMVWPRCITVAIPGTGYKLPVAPEDEDPMPVTGLLHVQVVGHDGTALYPGDVGLQITNKSNIANDLRYRSKQSEINETRVKALPGGGVLSGREVTLPVEDPSRQLLCVKWYSTGFLDDEGDSRGDGTQRTGQNHSERLTGEASIVLDELMRQAPNAREAKEVFMEVDETNGRSQKSTDQSNKPNNTTRTAQWGPVPVACELEPPIGADISSIANGAGGKGKGIVKRAAKGVGGFFGKTTSGVVAGYRAARSDGLRVGTIRDAVLGGWKEKALRNKERDAKDRERSGIVPEGMVPSDLNVVTAPSPVDEGAKVVRLKVRYQPLDPVELSKLAAMEGGEDKEDAELVDKDALKRNGSSETKSDSKNDDSPSGRKRNLIDGAFASGYFGGNIVGSVDAYDALENMRMLLREKDREINEMRVEKNLLAKKISTEGKEESHPVPVDTPKNVKNNASPTPAQERSRDRPGVDQSSTGKQSDAATLIASPIADADPKLSTLVAAARSASLAIEQARSQSRNDTDFSETLAQADALVAKAASAVRASAAKAETDRELEALKKSLAEKNAGDRESR